MAFLSARCSAALAVRKSAVTSLMCVERISLAPFDDKAAKLRLGENCTVEQEAGQGSQLEFLLSTVPEYTADLSFGSALNLSFYQHTLFGKYIMLSIASNKM